MICRRILVSLSFVALLGSCDGGPPVGPPPPSEDGPIAARLEVSATNVVFERLADSLDVVATVYGEAGAPLPSAPVAWRSLDPEVVTVSETGLLRPVRMGTSDVYASVGKLTARIQVEVRALEVSGRLISVDAEPVAPETRVFLTTASAEATIDVAEDGSFRGELGGVTPGTPITLWVDGEYPDSGRAHLPLTASFNSDSIPEEIRALLYPTSWRIEHGMFAGQSVDYSVHLFFEGPRNRDPTLDPVLADGPGFYARDPARYPLPVTFPRDMEGISHDPEHGWAFVSIGWTAEDSVRFWAGVEEFERRIGVDLFRPARAESVSERWPGGNGTAPVGGIAIYARHWCHVTDPVAIRNGTGGWRCGHGLVGGAWSANTLVDGLEWGHEPWELITGYALTPSGGRVPATTPELRIVSNVPNSFPPHSTGHHMAFLAHAFGWHRTCWAGVTRGRRPSGDACPDWIEGPPGWEDLTGDQATVEAVTPADAAYLQAEIASIQLWRRNPGVLNIRATLNGERIRHWGLPPTDPQGAGDPIR